MSQRRMQDMDRSKATKMTLLAQAGLGAGALALGAVVVTGVREQKAEQPPTVVTLPEVSLPAGANGPARSDKGTADSRGTADRFARLGNSPKAVVVAPVEVPHVVPVQPQETLTYHGLVSIGTRRMGLLKLTGKQKWVSLGDIASSDEKVLEIDPTFIRIGSAEPGRRIDLAARAGSSVTLGVVGNATQANASFAPINGMDRNEEMRRQQLEMMRQRQFGIGGDSAIPNEIGRKQADVPDYVSGQDEALFRKLRARMLREGKYTGQGDINEIAAKMLEQERGAAEKAAAEGQTNELTPDEAEAEAGHLKQAGSGGKPQ